MGWLENYPRAYYDKYEQVDVKNHGDWYQVYRLPGRVYAIAEPQQLQEVNAFLIIGEEAALLLDTGMGIVPIEPLVRELYQGPVLTVNSHAHFDHIGCNHQFASVHVLDCDYARRIAARGLNYEDVAGELAEECFQFGPPAGFVPEQYRVPPYDIIPIEDGHVFRLGGRNIRVIATGGHCQDHLCLYDENEHILFTGDLAYFGAMFANFDNELFGTSDLQRYTEQMQRLDRALPQDAVCCVSHNDPVLSRNDFHTIAEAFAEVCRREAAGESGNSAPAGMGFDFGEEGKQPNIYTFDGFSIYTRGSEQEAE